MTASRKKEVKSAAGETAHLVAMANDIAANLGFHADAGARVAEHLKKFWAPRMLQLLAEYASEDGRGLEPVVRAALEKLRPENSGAAPG